MHTHTKSRKIVERRSVCKRQCETGNKWVRFLIYEVIVISLFFWPKKLQHGTIEKGKVNTLKGKDLMRMAT